MTRLEIVTGVITDPARLLESLLFRGHRQLTRRLQAGDLWQDAKTNVDRSDQSAQGRQLERKRQRAGDTTTPRQHTAVDAP